MLIMLKEHCFDLLFRRREGCEVMWWVCLSVCLSVHSHNSKTTRPNFTKFSARCLGSWLRAPLMALQYVKYFRFGGWRHVFIPWGQWARRSSLCGGTGWTSDNYSVLLRSFIRMRHRGQSLLYTMPSLPWRGFFCITSQYKSTTNRTNGVRV